jgi:hypothetical protein
MPAFFIVINDIIYFIVKSLAPNNEITKSSQLLLQTATGEPPLLEATI